ncbi:TRANSCRIPTION INITIATION FACTOR IIA SUBUNIT 2 [Salix purpurea]|uniref:TRANSCRIPTION INITIATION FACTOR IIA SUBUNIT 2 n=2 Tax=Salix TaxID=40685 RepID=A0A9Q0USA5_SALPP|nr:TRANSCRIPTION INITIATION FACTOR IIA SUBUNIT 2 [Salix purpurea]
MLEPCKQLGIKGFKSSPPKKFFPRINVKLNPQQSINSSNRSLGMATFELYRRSTIGMCLTETLDDMVQNGTLSPELAFQVLVQFDKSMTEALEAQVKSKVSIKSIALHMGSGFYWFKDSLSVCLLGNVMYSRHFWMFECSKSQLMQIHPTICGRACRFLHLQSTIAELMWLLAYPSEQIESEKEHRG